MATIVKVDEFFDHHFFEGSSCAFGVFDGVHRGHQFLLRCARESVQAGSGKSIALTFDIDPDEMFNPDRLKKLMTNDDRISTLALCGIDAVVVLPFTKDFAALNPQAFLEKTFNGSVPKSLHIGSDFRFGARALGSIKELIGWGDRRGTEIDAHELKGVSGTPITSTRIRLALAEAEIEKANELLGRPYFIREQVQPGRGEGEAFGFKTANLHLSDRMQVLGDGVYAAYAEVDAMRYKAAVSVGVSPVFERETKASCEVHILDFEGNLYGKMIKVEFLHFLRPMIKFESKGALIKTVLGNIEWVRRNL